MHVLAGKYRRRFLQSSYSPKVRPTARRMRELLFEYLGELVEGARFLDLCAGSGAVGIEALSRGAAHATFVDSSLKMCRFVEQNLKQCGVPGEFARVVHADAAVFLRRESRRNKSLPWEIVFFDPPYAADYLSVLEYLARGALLQQQYGVIVAEHHCETELPRALARLRRLDVVLQGESCLTFYGFR